MGECEGRGWWVGRVGGGKRVEEGKEAREKGSWLHCVHGDEILCAKVPVSLRFSYTALRCAAPRRTEPPVLPTSFLQPLHYGLRS